MRSAKYSADGRRGWKRKLPPKHDCSEREKKRVSEENAIARIPLVVEIDLVDVDFELAIVIPPHVEVVPVVISAIQGTAP